VGRLDVAEGLLQDPLTVFPCQDSQHSKSVPSVGKKLFITKLQSFFTSTPSVVASSPWLTNTTPSTRSCAPSTTASPTSFSAEALQSRVTSSLPPPVVASSRESVLGSGSLQLPPFSRTGPLGVEGESVSVEDFGYLFKTPRAILCLVQFVGRFQERVYF
jgi:hypothetical protein